MAPNDDDDPLVKISGGQEMRWAEAKRALEPVREAREELRRWYAQMFEALRAILVEHDPIGIALEDVNPDEYDPEVGTILPRLRDAQSEHDVQSIVHEEFVRWFDESAGPLGRYEAIAHDVWQVLEGPLGEPIRGGPPG